VCVCVREREIASSAHSPRSWILGKSVCVCVSERSCMIERACVCVCVYVSASMCVCERERERGRDDLFALNGFCVFVLCVCVCVS